MADTDIGDNSFAEGLDVIASGITSHAEGFLTHATGFTSHSEGGFTAANGNFSHAEGSATVALGNKAHAEGGSTAAQTLSQHVQGEYNILDTEGSVDTRGAYAHIVGNGTADDARSNAHTLDWDGNAWFAGDVYIKSTSGTNKDEGSKKLATEEYVDSKAPIYQYGTEDLTAGVSELATGTLYFVYE